MSKVLEEPPLTTGGANDGSRRTFEAAGDRHKETDNLSLNRVLTYALPVVGFACMFMLFNMYYMKFATDTLLLAPGFVGAIFGIARLWDAVTDPVAGYLSDRTRHRLGRRRPWLLFSSLPIGLMFVAAFAPPASLSVTALSVWAIVSVLAFYTAMTAFVVPHMSLGAELVLDSKARSRLFGFRFGAEAVGYLLGLAAITYLISAEAQGPTVTRADALKLTIMIALLMAGMLIFTGLSLRERPEFAGRGGQKALRAYADVFRNGHACRVLFVAFVEYTGRAVTAVMALYVTEYVIKAPSYGPLVLLIWLVMSLVTVPLWVKMAARYGKKKIWVTALAVSSVAYGSMFFLGEGSILHLIIVSAITGAAAGCGGSVGPSTQSDVIDYDELKTGERKEGVYFACWNFVIKAGGGITVMLAGLVLEWSGFVPKVEQTELVKMSMLAFFALFPLVAYGAGALILSGFTFTEAAHAEVRDRLKSR